MFSEQQFTERWSKEEMLEALEQLKEKPDEIYFLFELLQSENDRVVFLVSWLLLNASKVKSLKPFFVEQSEYILSLLLKSKNTSFLRNGLRYFIEAGYDQKIEEDLINFCFESLDNKKQEVAILNNSFSLIEGVLKKSPEYIQPLYEVTYLALDYQPTSFKHKFRKFTAKYQEEIRLI